MAQNARLAARFGGLLAQERAVDAQAIQGLYGELPGWLPEPVLPGLYQALATLRNAGQDPQRISALVTAGRHGKYDVPGSALDRLDFIKSVNYLAHVQWALKKGKAGALEALAGKQAAKDHKRSKAGNERQAMARIDHLPEGHPLKRANSIEERNRIVCKHAEELRKTHPNLKQTDIRRRVADWTHLSKKQIGRIFKWGVAARLPRK